MRGHWPEYLIEACGLGLFMVSACAVTALVEHPSSPVRQAIGDATVRRGLIGLAMGLTAICIIYSPWGKQSGAHINPATTVTFHRLGKSATRDAAFYVCAQFVGASLGMALSLALLGATLSHPAVDFVVTVPGREGPAVAFVAEATISFVLMTTVLAVSNSRHARWTGLAAGVLVALYISVEAPLSGMSMNPARTFGSALLALRWMDLWIYFLAPPVGMLLAAELFVRLRGRQGVACAKLHHLNSKRCIFCEYQQRSVTQL